MMAETGTTTGTGTMIGMGGGGTTGVIEIGTAVVGGILMTTGDRTMIVHEETIGSIIVARLPMIWTRMLLAAVDGAEKIMALLRGGLPPQRVAFLCLSGGERLQAGMSMLQGMNSTLPHKRSRRAYSTYLVPTVLKFLPY